MTTQNFSFTATRRVLAKLALDFTTAILDPRITFNRNTSASNPATFVGSNGYIQLATNDQPRFNYDPVSLACNGLLIEESGTNIFQYSENFENAYWQKSDVSIVQNAISSPANTVTADKLVEAAVSGFHYLFISAPGWTGSNTVSIYAKAGERNSFLLTNASNIGYASFNVGNGTCSIFSGSATASISNVGNGWYRCICSVDNRLSTSGDFQLILTDNSGSANYVGNGVSGIYIWGAQNEARTFATSYIPTTSAALTRNADVATVTGTNFSDWWQADRGGVLVRALPSTVSGTRPLVQFDDATADNIIALRGNTANPELYIVDGGAPQAQIDAGAIIANTAYSLTGWWQTNFCAARKDNGARVEDLTATTPTVAQMRLGSDGTNYLNGHLATISYYDKFSGRIYTRRKNKAIFTVI